LVIFRLKMNANAYKAIVGELDGDADKILLESSMTDTRSRCSSVEGVSRRRVLADIMPCIGVRISWLILARNSDLSSALSLYASIRRVSAALRSVSRE
jgi:hypothetical protein